ncbi:Ankyrin repeat family protein [Rhynchospora pubera]|uniref:Ankyrin repeat family protein n=1 Tax=Rhynchospora pubera TaxID=906938 RepID=A0AAV8DF87_9POAL|nr:Ankyrin repeat family protein [Rhynchospora pubera]
MNQSYSNSRDRSVIYCIEMEIDTNKAFVKEEEQSDQMCTNIEVDTNTNNQVSLIQDSHISKISKKHRSQSADFTEQPEFEIKKKEPKKQEGRLSRHDRIEVGRSFQKAVSLRDWEKSEELILSADSHTLNDVLCIAVDSIWFLTSREELHQITRLIRKIIANGASDFTRATLRTSFLASCVSTCQGKNMSLTDAVTIMGQRLHERLEDCHGDEVLKVEAGTKVQKFTEWALRCIGSHARPRGLKNPRGIHHVTVMEVQLQLAAFKSFLDLADNQITGKDFTEAFDAACFPLTLFSNSFEPGWVASVSAGAVEGLLEMLVEGGADNVNQCFLEASRFGSTELVQILLQIAQRNSLDIDVDLALGFASHYAKIPTMEFLVDGGGASAFLGPLMRAAERGSVTVVEWFVSRGCRDMELCLAVTAAAAASQLSVVSFLLPHVPRQVLAALSLEILKAAADRCAVSNSNTRSFDGVAFLLRSDFLGDPAATYAVADSIARSEDGVVMPELRSFLQEHWSEEAYEKGVRCGQEHFVNLVRILERGEMPVGLRDLPRALVVAIGYLPLYRECVEAGGPLLPQSLRGQLVEAVNRLSDRPVDKRCESTELLAILEHHLPAFLI